MTAKANYNKLARARPDLFTTPQDGFEILTDGDDIARAEQSVAALLKSRGEPEHWAEVGLVFEDHYNMIVRDAVRFPDTSYGTYFRIINKAGDPCGSAVLSTIEEDVVFIRHYRHAVQNWLVEIPKGGREPGETFLETAERELFEEIGGRAPALTDLGIVHTSSGLAQESFQLYFAKLERLGSPNTDEGVAEIIRIPQKNILDWVSTNETTDSIAMAAILRAVSKGLLVAN